MGGSPAFPRTLLAAVRASTTSHATASSANSTTLAQRNTSLYVVMVLVAISTGSLTSQDVAAFTAGRNLEDDAEIEALIAWLRTRRPHFFEG